LWTGILFAWLYPLSRAEYALVVAGLEERRAEAKTDLLEIP
jgi:hypothetical protein